MIIAAGVVTRYDWQPDKRFMVRLDIYSYTTENYAPDILTSQSFSVDDAEGFVNAGIYTFLRDYITRPVDEGGWGMTIGADDTIEIINPYIKASAVAALNSKFSVFWKLDEDTDAALPLSDSVGGFDLTNNNGVTFGAGAVGAAANFYPAASMKSLSRAYDAALNPTDGLTFSCRVKFGYTGTIQGIAGTWTATSKGWALVMDAAGVFQVYVAADALDVGDNYGTIYGSPGYWNDGLWHTVVVRIDGAGVTDDDRLQVTVDDVLQPLLITGAIPAAIMDDGGEFTIGNWNGNHADGVIDECDLRDLSGALIAQWKFDGNPRLDSVGSNDLAEIGTVAREAAAGGGWAAVIAGGPAHLAINDSPDLASGDFDWSIALWVKPPSGAGLGPIFSSWYMDPVEAASRAVYELWWDPTVNGGLPSLSVHDGVTLNQYLSSFLTVPIDRWSFIVVQYDAAADTISVQVNQQIAEAFVLPAPILSDSSRFAIGLSGSDYLGAQYFTGAIRRVGYAPHLLTEAEVLTLWNNGAGQDWPMEEAQPEGNTRYCRLGVDHEVSDTTKTVVPGMSFVLDLGVHSIEYTLFTTSSDEAIGVQFAVVFDGTSENGRCHYNGPASPSASQCLAADTPPLFTFDPTTSQGNVPGTVKISGTIEVSEGGTLSLTHGSSDASLTTVLRGSWGMCARHNS